MNKNIKRIIIFIAILFKASFLYSEKTSVSEKESIEKKEKLIQVSIIQNDKEYQIQSNLIKIKKKPFYFKFILRKEADLKINFSDQSHIMNAAKNGIHPVYLRSFLPGSSFAGYSDNRCKYFIISNEGSHFWGYNKEDGFNRFTKIVKEKKDPEYWKEIRFYYDPEQDKEIPIEKLPQSRLFITIIYQKPFLGYDAMPKKRVSFRKALNEAKNEESKKYFQWLIDSRVERGYYYDHEDEETYSEEYAREYFILDFE